MTDKAETALTYTPFFFDRQEVRTVKPDGDARFVGSDVRKRLGYANPSEAMADH
jgi:prophage antirepressor-like protein